MKKTIVCLTMMVVMGIVAAKAQDAQTTGAEDKKADFSLHFGGAVPLGDFGDSRIRGGKLFVAWATGESDKGGAGFGVNAGVKLKFDIPSVKGLSIIATADLFWNGANADLKDWREDLIEETLDNEEEIYELEIRMPNYLNIPIMVGLNYEYNLNNEISVWGEGALGLNIAKITNYKFYAEGSDYYYNGSSEIDYYYEERGTTQYDIQTSMAFQVGIGVKFADKFSIGLHYYALGKIKLKGEYYEERYTDDTEYGADEFEDSYKFRFKSINPSIFAIRLGYHF